MKNEQKIAIVKRIMAKYSLPRKYPKNKKEDAYCDFYSGLCTVAVGFIEDKNLESFLKRVEECDKNDPPNKDHLNGSRVMFEALKEVFV